MLTDIERKLKAPFPYKDVAWRMSRLIEMDNDTFRATTLAYIDSRAVMERLENVFGIQGWQNEYDFIESPKGQSGFICTIHCLINDKWISKSDGAPQTDFESFKGGLSDAFKRAGVKWGIGRYLYGLSETWVDIHRKKPQNVPKGKEVMYGYDKNRKMKYYWITPDLPKWALPVPDDSPTPKKETEEELPEPEESIPETESADEIDTKFSLSDEHKEKLICLINLKNIKKSQYDKISKAFKNYSIAEAEKMIIWLEKKPDKKIEPAKGKIHTSLVDEFVEAFMDDWYKDKGLVRDKSRKDTEAVVRNSAHTKLKEFKKPEQIQKYINEHKE